MCSQFPIYFFEIHGLPPGPKPIIHCTFVRDGKNIVMLISLILFSLWVASSFFFFPSVFFFIIQLFSFFFSSHVIMEHFYSLEFILTYIITACGRVSDEIFFSTLHKDYGIKVQDLLKKKLRIGIKINIIKKKGYFVYFYCPRSMNFYALVPNFVQILHFNYKNVYINFNCLKLNNKDFKWF